jgi:excisionase family DNA binding protein
MATTDLPKLITVAQAARALRIGRSTAYDLAHAWLDSNGAEGMPVVRIGRTMRVPVAALERLLAIGGFGPAWNSGLDRRRGPRVEPTSATDDHRPEPPLRASSTSTTRHDDSAALRSVAHQLTLFDALEA